MTRVWFYQVIRSTILSLSIDFRFSNSTASSKSSRDPWSGGGGGSVGRDSHHPDPLSSAAFHHHREVNAVSTAATLNGLSGVNGLTGHASPDASGTISNMARPGIKLEALPPRSTTAKRRKNKKPNALEPL